MKGAVAANQDISLPKEDRSRLLADKRKLLELSSSRSCHNQSPPFIIGQWDGTTHHLAVS